MGRLYQLTYTLKAPCVYYMSMALKFWEDFQTNQATTNTIAFTTAWYRVTHVPTVTQE